MEKDDFRFAIAPKFVVVRCGSSAHKLWFMNPK